VAVTFLGGGNHLPATRHRSSNSKTKIHSYNAEMHIRFTGEVSIEITRINQNVMGGCRGRDRMVVGFTLIYAISDYHL
jgi:hypothetical protein